MALRDIVHIDEELCNGCGQCIPNCHEGALQLIDGKARLVSDLFCDGLGACLGHCPVGAISIEKRDAEAYDEKKVMEKMASKGENTIRAHLVHLREHGAMEFFNQGVEYLKENGIPVPSGVLDDEPKAQECETLACGCPGSQVRSVASSKEEPSRERRPSRLSNWPTQLMLVPVHAPFLQDSDLVLAADCVPFAYPDFHEEFLRGKVLINACPKLDNAEHYVKKLAEMFKNNRIRSISVVHMEVPCCFGLRRMVELALRESGADIPLEDITIGVQGEIKSRGG
ncbi:MAG: 4Fe-4S binding protein [Candidatus Thermoplasmatota archaeon]|nr:4Fe-4S binding protein [Candidatus Thermoplasmatota archaeon]